MLAKVTPAHYFAEESQLQVLMNEVWRYHVDTTLGRRDSEEMAPQHGSNTSSIYRQEVRFPSITPRGALERHDIHSTPSHSRRPNVKTPVHINLRNVCLDVATL